MVARVAQRLPAGATLDQAEADRIAGDEERAAKALGYWKNVLQTLECNPFDDDDTVTLKAIRAIPNVVFDRSPDPAVARVDVLPPEGGEFGSRIKFSGCGISGSEIAAFLGVGSFDDVLASAKTLVSAAQGAAPRRNAGLALRACRELHDAARRIAAARAMAVPARVSVAEALTLHRQEGGFAVTPDAPSFPHAPLTLTAPGTCRTPDVTLAADALSDASRPGFNLAFRLNEIPAGTDQEVMEEVARFFTAVVNSLVLGGLDILASRVAQPNPAIDELAAMVTAALQADGPLGKDSTIRLLAASPLLTGFAAGVAMIELEGATRLPDDVEEFFERVRQRLSALLAAHNVELVDGDIRIKGHDARDLKYIGRLQADWYGSRTNPVSMRPWTARSEQVHPGPGLSPFMAYLRFNMGDTSFLMTLLRTAVNIKRIEAFWRTRRKRRVPEDLSASLDRIGGGPSGRAAETLKRLLFEWTALSPQSRKVDQHAWKVAGLIERWQMTQYPAWAPRKAPDGASASAAIAAFVSRAMDTLDAQRIFPAIGVALEWTPVEELRRQNIPTDLRAFSRAHTFARHTLVYGPALTEAGISDDPLRRWGED